MWYVPHLNNPPRKIGRVRVGKHRPFCATGIWHSLTVFHGISMYFIGFHGFPMPPLGALGAWPAVNWFRPSFEFWWTSLHSGTAQIMAFTEPSERNAAAFLYPSSEQWEAQGYVWSGLLKQQFLLQMHLPFCWMLHVSVTLLRFTLFQKLLQHQQPNVTLYRLYNVLLCACLFLSNPHRSHEIPQDELLSTLLPLVTKTWWARLHCQGDGRLELHLLLQGLVKMGNSNNIIQHLGRQIVQLHPLGRHITNTYKHLLVHRTLYIYILYIYTYTHKIHTNSNKQSTKHGFYRICVASPNPVMPCRHQWGAQCHMPRYAKAFCCALHP